MRAAWFLTLFAITIVVVTCKTAPPPAAGAPQGTFCGTDLECDDGLVCTCGTCALPSGEDEPPACNVTVGCPAFPTACVNSCDDPRFAGNADCAAGVETCAVGVLQTSCAPGCPDPIPSGFQCENGQLVCTQPAISGGCLTGDCDGQTPFLCVLACDDPNPFLASCIDHQNRCDEGGFPQDVCADAGADAGVVDSGADGGPCAVEPKPQCLFECDPAQPIDGAACRAEDGGPFDWSCSGFPGYTPADRCGTDAGPADAGVVDAGDAG